MVRLPAGEEEARRARGRRREQLHGELRRMRAMGAVCYCKGRWW